MAEVACKLTRCPTFSYLEEIVQNRLIFGVFDISWSVQNQSFCFQEKAKAKTETKTAGSLSNHFPEKNEKEMQREGETKRESD